MLTKIRFLFLHGQTTLGTELRFTVGEQPVKDFRMIERHYFKDKVVKSYDFTLPFCMPSTTNSWEVSYYSVLRCLIS